MLNDTALKTDLYELTMAAGYFQNNLNTNAVFELSCHTMPEVRSYLVACGLRQAVDYILNLRFSAADIKFLKSLPVFKHVHYEFFEYLRGFRFSGDVWGLPEGEIYFAKEPILQISAPIIEAQVLETFLLSVTNIESLVATKASRIARAACADGIERSVVDFGSRRAHGPEAGVLAARAAYLAGCVGTSNVYAGGAFGIANFGTMAHSWVEAFDKEEDAFAKYANVFPESAIVLVDTYDTLAGVKKAIGLKKEIKGVRLDSGDLKVLSKKVRKLLDQNGRPDVKIIASGNLNEYKIFDLVKAKAPIDIFGVGTDMAISRDCPALDLTYKLVEISDGKGGVKSKAKRSQGKATVPGRKQVFRAFSKDGIMEKDTIGLFSESVPKNSQPLLRPIIKAGQLVEPLPDLEASRRYLQNRLVNFELASAKHPGSFKVVLSEKIEKLRKEVLLK